VGHAGEAAATGALFWQDFRPRDSVKWPLMWAGSSKNNEKEEEKKLDSKK
jgi:hypothetical protein